MERVRRAWGRLASQREAPDPIIGTAPASTSSALPPIERIGAIDVPSGDLLLVDFGFLSLWSDDRVPQLRPGDVPDDLLDAGNDAVDLFVTGPDALRLVAAIDSAFGRGSYFFDVGRSQLPEFRARLDAVISDQGFDARVQELDERIPHQDRARRLLDESPLGVEVPFFGPWAIAVRGTPMDRRLSVYGRRMDPGGPDRGRWRSVWIEISDSKVIASEQIGYVLVDQARLMFSDLKALGRVGWDAAPDSLMDVVFWGRDEASVAAKLGAPSVDDGSGRPVFGWVGATRDEARERVGSVQEMEQLGSKIRLDVRPHNDVYRILKQARASLTGAGTVEVGGVAVCGFFTSWGDGAFPVYRDIDAAGALAKLRVELGAPEIVTRIRRFEAETGA